MAHSNHLTCCLLALALGASSLTASPVPAQKQEAARLAAILNSGVSQKEKADACRELARIGTKEAVPALAALLPDPSLSHMARYGLETIPDSSVDKAFRNALKTLHGRELVGVIGSVGVRRDTGSVSQLAKLLNDGDSEVARAAARALGSIGTAAAAKALKAAVDSGQANRLAVCEGLFRCAERAARERDLKNAMKICDFVRSAPDAPHQVRLAALRGAILTRQEAGLPLLAETLASPDYQVFAQGVRVSMEVPGPRATGLLTEQLSKSNADRQILLTQTLGRRHDASALPALLNAARNCEKNVRVGAIKAIAELSDPAAVPVLTELMRDADREVAAAAQESLASIPGPQVDAAVLAMLRSTEPDVVVTGIDLVGRRRMASAISDLSRLASGSEAKTRIPAVRKLGELADVSQMPTFLGLVRKADNPADLEAAEQALTALSARAGNPDNTAKTVADSFSGASSAQKAAFLRVLASIGGPEALKSVRVSVKENEAEVRTAAIRALGGWSSMDAAGDLLELARNATAPNEKLLCLRGYLSLAAHPESTPEKRLAMCTEAVPLVQQPDEKKLLLGTLGDMNAPRALELIAPYLEDEAIKNEAQTAYLNVAEKVLQRKSIAPAATKMVPVLERLSQDNSSQALNKRAKSMLEQAKAKAAEK